MSFLYPNRNNAIYNDVAHVENVIRSNYGDIVSVKEKGRNLRKFGRTDQMSDSLTTVMELPTGTINETYATGNTIDSLSCSDNNFDGIVPLEGHTISGNDLTFIPSASNRITATGHTPVGLNVDLARSTRGFIADTTALAEGQFIYIYDSTANVGGLLNGVPQTAASIHLVVQGGRYRQSQKASTSISSVDYWIISSWAASIGANKTATAELFLQVRTVNTEEFRTVDEFFLSSTNPKPSPKNYPLGLIIPKNSDVRVVGSTVGSSPASAVTVSSELFGTLALVIGSD